MRRDQLEHAIRTACQIIGHDAVVVVGSPSILGSFTEAELPAEATMSTEIDILPLGKDGSETARPADHGASRYTGSSGRSVSRPRSQVRSVVISLSWASRSASERGLPGASGRASHGRGPDRGR